MNKKFTKLIAALALLVFMTPSLAGWGQTQINLAEWEFTSTNYPSNGTDFNATGGPCASGSTFYLNGTGSTWNTSKGYAFTSVTDITITLKLDRAVAVGEKITLYADAFYNKSSNAPVKAFDLTVSQNGGSYETTGLNTTKWSLTNSEQTFDVTYTIQSELSQNSTIAIKLTRSGNAAGTGQAYINNIYYKYIPPYIAIGTAPTAISMEYYDNYADANLTTNIPSPSFSVEYFESDGETAATYDWIAADVYQSNGYVFYCILEENEGEERTAYLKVFSGTTPSNLVTITQGAAPTKVETPTFNPVGGTFNTAQSVVLNCTTPNAAIYYTTNGTIPSATNGTLYESAIAVNGTQTIKAIGIKDGLEDSDIASQEYILKVLAPTVTVSGGTYYENKSVELACETAGATIRYTLDDAVPTASSTEYSSAITIDHNCTLRAKAFKENWTSSEEVSAAYVIKMNAPSFEVAGGTYDATQSVPLNVTNGASIYYTTNGDTPSSTNGILYVSPITVESTTTIKAIAVKANCTDSEIAEATYTLKANSPSFDQTAGTYTGTQTITITNNTTESSIKYKTTENGDWMDYPTDGINLATTTTLWAKAQKTNLEDSEVVSATYVIKYPIVVYQSTGGTISASQSLEEAGQTITLTASANIGYTFGAWDVKDGQNQAVTVNENSFTMPASNVSVRATFNTDANVHTVSFSINGTINMTATIASGAIDLSKFKANVTTEGYELKGWSETDDGSIITNNSYTPSEDKTLFAVFGEMPEYELVASASNVNAGTYLICAKDGNNYRISTGIITGSTNTDMNVTSSAYSPTNNIFSGLPDENACEFILAGNSTDGFTISNGTTYLGYTEYSSRKLDWSDDYSNYYWKFGDDSDGGVYLQRDHSTTQKYTISHNATNGTAWIRGYANATSYTGLYLFKKSASSGGNATVAATPKLTGVPSNVVVKVVNNGVVTFTGTNNNASNLIIEDGSQLIATNTGVQATVKKAISAHSAAGQPVTGWKFIASPIVAADGIAPTSVANMADADFDLYKFNQEADLEWENYKKVGDHYHFNLYNGQGYLYASKEGTTLNFMGFVNSSADVNVNLAYTEGVEFAGWNLVGNPYTFYAFLNKPYYKMNDYGSAILATAQSSDSIAPCTGVMVHVDAVEQNVTFSKNAFRNATTGNLNIAVVQVNERGASTTTIDNAIVSFNEGSELPKFYFGNPNANLYIPQNDKEYAILSAEGQGEMPLNFRANADGQYTLTVNPEGVEMNYLHLIDNMTGNDIDLLQTPSYSFNAKTTDYESRFRLVFAANNESGVSASSTTFAFYSNGNWMVNNEGEATLQVIDVMGRVLSNQTISGTAELSLNQQPGVYVLRLVNGNDVKTQKIVVR